MKTYVLFVHCVRDGITRDAGEHAQCESESDEAAVIELEKEVQWLKKYYDSVSYKIIEDKRIVKSV